VAANQNGVVKASLETLHPHLFMHLDRTYVDQVRREIILDEDVRSNTLKGSQADSECRALESLRAFPMQSSAPSARLVQRLTFEDSDASDARGEIDLIDKLLENAPSTDATAYKNKLVARKDRHGITNDQKLTTIGRRIALAMVARAARLASDIELADRFTGVDLRGTLSDTSVRREIFLAEIVGHSSPEVANDLAEELSRKRAQLIRKLLIDSKSIGSVLVLGKNCRSLTRSLNAIYKVSNGSKTKLFIDSHHLHLVARGSGAREPIGDGYHERL
jgi:hypothetical protein